MQSELDALGFDIKLLSINKIAAESGTGAFSADMNLPMVQDTEPLGVWSDWGAIWRDVYLVDADNRHISTYNLTEHNLSESENYEALKAMFIEMAD